jgi:AcrR family transcriptional regulator
VADARKTDEGKFGTREALLASAIHLFGYKGYDGTSTREISSHAGANVAAIAYHFGSKEGLRIACGDTIAERLQAALPAAGGEAPTPSEAARQLEANLRAMVAFLVLDAGADDVATFLLREVVETGPLLDRVYSRLIEPRHRELCWLWSAATGSDPESETTRLAVFAMVGQILYFRIGQPLILRRMGWRSVDAAAARRIADLLAANLRAALDVHTAGAAS